jgi:hypothetical protein
LFSKKKPRRILNKKFFDSLKELDNIKNPSLIALGRQAICRFYGLPNLSLRFIIACWILLVLTLVVSLLFWSWWKALLLELGLLVICATSTGFVLMYEGGLTERGMLSLLKAGFSALIKYPQMLVGNAQKGKP